MQRSAYFHEARRLSIVFEEKLKALNDFFSNDPELRADGAYEKYWDLENEANAAGGEWTNFCSRERPLVHD